MENRSDRFTALEDQYAGYEVYDRNGEKIGKVDDLFVDENDQPEYLQRFAVTLDHCLLGTWRLP